ncbi:5-hydroxyisourate hydrolase [Pichia kudriavzevii]|nr:5-hydroxyisourate hydrolase [Pichia kudriavzevii]
MDSQVLESGTTDSDGRIKWRTVVPQGTYSIRFFTKEYFQTTQRSTFFPWVDIVFTVEKGEKYHVPLLLSNYGYSTYRGS